MRDMSETESEKGPFTGQGEVTEMEQKKTVQTENKMGVMPVDRLLVSMSLPMMISMLVQALYNIVDSIFVSRVSEQALRAVSLALFCPGHWGRKSLKRPIPLR